VSAAASRNAPRGVVVAVTPPPREGVADSAPALAACAAALSGRLGARTATLTWEPADEADLDGLSGAVARVLRDRAARVAIMADGDLERQLAPMVALKLRTSAAVGCSDVVVRDGEAVYVKPVQGGWLEREVTFAPGFVQIATVQVDAAVGGTPVGPPESRGTRWIARVAGRRGGGEAPVRRLDIVPPDPRTVDLVHARRIVGVGVGGAGDEVREAVEELAELLQGSLGATRPVVDDGRLPKERLIGQTGRTVAPDLYLALGISGSPHHVAGIQGADHIVAVNQDEYAPIASFSDASFVAHLEDVLPALVRRLRAIRDGDETPGAPLV
jgi:electron transfer flavoprotein alpha subunit